MITNVVDLGTYVSGDTGTDTVISLVAQDGTPVSLLGATALSLEARSAQGEKLSVVGTINGDPSNGQVIFEDIAQAFTPTVTRRRVVFEGVVKWTLTGETYWSRDRASFAIELFP